MDPGGILSLQKHHHRAEHWIVVKGTARITIDGEAKLLSENQSVYVPLGATHRLENPGLIPLTLIGVQSGPYLGRGRHRAPGGRVLAHVAGAASQPKS